MYNPLLDTFIAVADWGSFTKAANQLYISPTAVMKKINTLEQHLELKLVERTSSGIHLTEAGKLIYQGARFMMNYSAKSIANARSAMYARDTIFRVGTSLLNPARPFIDLWYKASSEFPEYKLHLVPFEDDHESILEVIGQLGTAFDFLIGVCDSKAWLSRCRFLPIGRYRKMVSVPRNHPLVEKQYLEPEDLYGETLIMVKQGDSPVNDFIRSSLKEHHPAIHIEDAPQFYDLSVFNRCVETGHILLCNECWKDVHPDLVTIPVNWNYNIPYGLLYSQNASKDALRFVEIVKKLQT